MFICYPLNNKLPNRRHFSVAREWSRYLREQRQGGALCNDYSHMSCRRDFHEKKLCNDYSHMSCRRDFHEKKLALLVCEDGNAP